MSETSENREQESETGVSDGPTLYIVFVPEFSCFAPHLGHSLIPPVLRRCKALDIPALNRCKDIIRLRAVNLEHDPDGLEITLRNRSGPHLYVGVQASEPRLEADDSPPGAHILYALDSPQLLNTPFSAQARQPLNLSISETALAATPVGAPGTISPSLLLNREVNVDSDNWVENQRIGSYYVNMPRDLTTNGSDILLNTSMLDSMAAPDVNDDQLSARDAVSDLEAGDDLVSCPPLEDSFYEDRFSPFESAEEDVGRLIDEDASEFLSDSFSDLNDADIEESPPIVLNAVIVDEQHFFQGAAGLPLLDKSFWYSTNDKIGNYSQGLQEKFELQTKEVVDSCLKEVIGEPTRPTDVITEVTKQNADSVITRRDQSSNELPASEQEGCEELKTDTRRDFDGCSEAGSGEDSSLHNRPASLVNPAFTVLMKSTGSEKALPALLSTRDLTVRSMEYLKRKNILRKRRNRNKYIRKLMAGLDTKARPSIFCPFANCICAHTDACRERTMSSHILAVHSKSKPLSCQICAREYSRSDALRRHERAAHGGASVQDCEQSPEASDKETDETDETDDRQPELDVQWKLIQEALQPAKDSEFFEPNS